MTSPRQILFDSQHEKIVFAFVCLVFIWLQLNFGLQHFYYDAEGYWERARQFDSGDGFSVYHFIEARGVLFPLFNFLLIKIAEVTGLNEINMFKSLNVLFICWGLWYVLPGIYCKATGKSLNTLSRLILIILTQVFWFRAFSEPLTDFMCLFLLLYTFLLVWSDTPSYSGVMLAGLICGYVFNTRPLYNILLFVLPLFILTVIRDKAIWKTLKIVVFILASVFISIPQYLVNQQRWKTTTIFQPTSVFYAGQSLYLIQLKWGLYIQKYETYIGSFDCYPSAQMFFYHNENHVEEQHRADSILTYADYFEYISRHPSTILRYAKNLFNGLDIRYNSVYITTIAPNRYLAVLNYCVFFAGICLLVLCRKKLFAGKGFRIVFACLAITTALSVPTAIEVRFMTAAYFLMYLIIAAEWNTGWAYWKSRTKIQKSIIIGVLIIWIIARSYLSAETYAHLEYPVLC